MPMIDLLQPDFTFADERGELVQLVHEGYRQVNVVFSKNGVVRGGHFHRDNREVFYVISGSFRLDVSDGTAKEHYVFRGGDMFRVNPNIVHEFTFLEDTLLVGMYDRGVELAGGNKDIIAAPL